MKWYQVCLFGIISGSFAIMLTAMVAGPVRRLSTETRQTSAWILVFLIGSAGTTFLSPLMKDFVFTWPVCLFATFQMLMDRLALTRKTISRRERWRSGIACVIFLATCFLYFLACRRLSLVFEWVFLGGFAAALPFSMAGKILFRERRWHWVWKAVCVAASFTAFFWSSVAFLHLRVR